jgi:hypothetical protein
MGYSPTYRSASLPQLVFAKSSMFLASARQEFEQDSTVRANRPCAIKYLALPALGVSFDEADIRKAELFEQI